MNRKTILVTGANGFIGKNLCTRLNELSKYEVLKFDEDDDILILEEYLQKPEIIVHLAGVNRPKEISEFNCVNLGLTEKIIQYLNDFKNTPKIIFTSSTQAVLDNPYGSSKKLAENALIKFGQVSGSEINIYRLANVFGKWCKPNYNSVVASFCHNIANGLPIQINDENKLLELLYIDDVVNDIIVRIKQENKKGFSDFLNITPAYKVTLGRLAALIKEFNESRINLLMPDFSDQFIKNLYSTYLSYLPDDGFSYDLKKHKDARGSLTELLKFPKAGQIFVSKSHSGILRGNHYHHTKVEKFIVINGEAIIRFRKIDADKVISYKVSGDDIKVVDIPPGYTHNIENVGSTELTVLFWANEIFNPDKPDTNFLSV